MGIVSAFLSQEHKQRYEKLLTNDGTKISDKERFALFYLIAGNGDLYSKRNLIYDFREHRIRMCLSEDDVSFSSGCEALIRLGFNLYNRYRDDSTSPLDLLANLDQDNRILAFNAMAVRLSVNWKCLW